MRSGQGGADKYSGHRNFLRRNRAEPVRVALNGLTAQDLKVDCLLGCGNGGEFLADRCVRLQVEDPGDGESAIFLLDWAPEFCGLKSYRLRVYPYHALLSHPFETGCMCGCKN